MAAPKKKPEPQATTTALAPVNQTTGEIMEPVTAPAEPTPALALTFASVASASQAEILLAPLTDDEVDILPTGEVYLSQVGYRRRLNAAFGPGNWRMVDDGPPLQMGNTLAQRWHLQVYGQSLAVSYGEAEYYAENNRQSWATAWESAKSNGLMRLCKDLGIASECWDRRWTEAFKQRRCLRVHRSEAKRDPYQWRRIDAPAWYDEDYVASDSPNRDAWQGPDGSGRKDDRPVEGARSTAGGAQTSSGQASGRPEGRDRPRKPISEKQKARLFAITASRAEKLGCEPKDVQALVKAEIIRLGFASSADITMDRYDEIVAFAEKADPFAGDDAPSYGGATDEPAEDREPGDDDI